MKKTLKMIFVLCIISLLVVDLYIIFRSQYLGSFWSVQQLRKSKDNLNLSDPGTPGYVGNPQDNGEVEVLREQGLFFNPNREVGTVPTVELGRSVEKVERTEEEKKAELPELVEGFKVLY
jgi:hypothetical protein